MKIFISLLLNGYKRFFSPDHGICSFLFPYGFCKFYPSCSHYTHLALNKYGLGRGLVKGLHRIFRCHPWSQGGIDHP